MAQSIVGEKSLVFAKRIAKCYVFLKEEEDDSQGRDSDVETTDAKPSAI